MNTDESMVYAGRLRHALKKTIFVDIFDGNRTYKAVPPNMVDNILSEEMMIKYFIPAFTHQSIDYENNYEKLEKIGDLFANAFIGKIITEKFPDLDPSEISNMLSHYKSNIEFSNLMSKLNLDEFIRISSKFVISDKIKGDVFEALVYAIIEACNSVLPGIGYACSFNVYKLITRDLHYNLENTKGNPRSLIDSIFGKSVSEYPRVGSIFTGELTVYINLEKIITIQKTYNKQLSNINASLEDLITKIEETSENSIQFTSKARDRKTASFSAYTGLLNILKEYGFTPKTYDEAVRIKFIEDYIRGNEVFIKQKKLNETIYFQKIKIDEGIEWKLIAIKNLTQKKELVSMTVSERGPNTFPEAKKDLLKKYLDEDSRIPI
jgi:hypothetical protein